MITNDVIKIVNKAHLFNTLDFSKNISNLYVDEKQIVDKNYRANSILVRIFDFEIINLAIFASQKVKIFLYLKKLKNTKNTVKN